jgi:hypothetical protein
LLHKGKRVERVAAMRFDFEKCRSLVLAATLAELDAARSILVPEFGLQDDTLDYDLQITGIALDIAPWHPRFCLGMRDMKEKVEEGIKYSIGDWKLYPLNGLANPSAIPASAAAADYIAAAYEAANEQRREVAHLVFLAAAEALLDPTVTQKLLDFKIDAPYVEDDFLPHRFFEYIVADEDESVAINYCELVVANRITNRLKLEFH